MSEADELERAVVAEPEPDAPRRAYAAWAKSRGDMRGTFVEVQLELAAKFRAHCPIAEWSPLFRRSEAILEEYRALWLEPFEDLVWPKLIRDVRFMRGFVEHIAMDAKAFAENADRIYRRMPVLHLTLTGVRDHPDVLTSPSLGRIVSLDIHAQELDDAAIALLASSPHASRLRWLDLSLNTLTDRSVEALCSSPHLRGLQYVECRGNDFTDPIDHYGYEGEAIVHSEPSAEGIELERRYGRIAWLHAPDVFDVEFPPGRDAVEPA